MQKVHGTRRAGVQFVHDRRAARAGDPWFQDREQFPDVKGGQYPLTIMEEMRG
jgi:hypothetical protein